MGAKGYDVYVRYNQMFVTVIVYNTWFMAAKPTLKKYASTAATPI